MIFKEELHTYTHKLTNAHFCGPIPHSSYLNKSPIAGSALSLRLAVVSVQSTYTFIKSNVTFWQ